jgi:tetratricopeptide (TPR) repeat protein
MSIFAKMLGLNPESYLSSAEFSFNAGRFGEAKIEYQKALELISAEETQKQADIQEKIIFCCEKLADMHIRWAESCIESGELEKAIDEYQLSMELVGEESPRRRDIKKLMDDAKRSWYRMKSLTEATPFIERGEEFLDEKHYNGALVEFQQALKILKYFTPLDESKKVIVDKLGQVEEIVVRPYIERGDSLISTQLFDEAIQEFEKALSLITVNEKLSAEIESLIRSTMKERGSETKSDDHEVFISRQEWDKALGEYSKLLEKYFSYTNQESDPYKAYHDNPYESEFRKAKQLVGSLYVQRADGYFNIQKYAVALKYFVEAQNFYDATESELTYIQGKIKECKDLL